MIHFRRVSIVDTMVDVAANDFLWGFELGDIAVVVLVPVCVLPDKVLKNVVPVTVSLCDPQ